MTLLTALAFFTLGLLGGAFAIAVWWMGKLKNPTYRAGFLAGFNRTSSELFWPQKEGELHCPCCGWSAPVSLGTLEDAKASFQATKGS